MSTRNQRRQLQRKLTTLEAQRDVAQARLVDAENRLDVSVTGTIAEIEKFVDLLAQEVRIDEKRPDRVDPRIYEVVAKVGWRGVTTPEAAKEAVVEEVARRSVSRTDLALLLSSIDHTACIMWANLPASLRDLHGEPLRAAALERLTIEDFPAELVRDARWAEMRGRWIRMGWRGARDEMEFMDAFIRDVVERVVLLHDGQSDDILRGGLSLLHDTVIDEQLDRVRPEARALMEWAFKERLDREWKQLTAKQEVPLDFLAEARGNPVALEALREVMAERTDDEWRQAAAKVEALIAPSSAGMPDRAEFRLLDNPAKALPYSDHALMRHGRELWELTYKAEKSNEEVRDTVMAATGEVRAALTDHKQSWSTDVSIFAAKWAVHAFQRLMTSHTFAAALMCSDVQREVLEGIEQQWDAFLVVIPNGMLVAGGFEFSRVLVATYSYGAWLGLLAPDGAGFRLLDDESRSLAELLASDEADLAQDSPSQRCVVLAKRLVAGLLLNLQDSTTHKVRKVEARQKSKSREAEPEHRIVTIGAPLEIDCRDAVKEYVERGTRSSEKTGRHNRGMPTVQWMVRGHYRMQAHGPQHALRRKQWIRPFWKGNEAALIQTRARVPS